jgi:phosphopantetheinyl transferase
MVTLMIGTDKIIPTSFGSDSPRLLCMMMPIEHLKISDVLLANNDEVAKFVTEKRHMEHLAGRYLLQLSLAKWGVDSSLIEVRRNEFRAPSIAYLPGTWKRTPLPSISIGHSSGYAFVALVESGWTVGIDAEPEDLVISKGVFDMMAKGDELSYLNNNPNQAVRLWTSKESIQKSARLGMNLNPRNIRIPIGETKSKLSIENSIFQLENLISEGFFISISYCLGEGYDSIPEDKLLEQTQRAMSKGEDWSVGCKTTRSNA